MLLKFPRPQGSIDPTEASSSQWSESLQTTLDQPPSAFPLRLAFAGIVFSGLFLTWACVGHVDEVAKARGKLVPKDGIYKIHSVDMGKVIQLSVKEGDSVKAGQVLANLDTDILKKDVERLEKSLSGSQVELTQVKGLLDKTRLESNAQKEEAQALVAAQEVAVSQAQMAAGNTQTIVAQFQEDTGALKARLGRLQPLSDAGAISKEIVFEAQQQLRDRTRSLIESQGSLQRTQAEVERMRVELQSRQAEADRMQLEAQQKIQELSVKQTALLSKITETKVLLEAAKTKLNQSTLRAPIDGTVLTLNTRQVGEVVQPGMTIAEIAPTDKPLILSTVLPSQDVGFVKPDMPVKIKLDAFPYQSYGVIAGKVISISSDSKPDEKLGQVYRVDVELFRSSMNAKGQTIPFKPGETASAEIVTQRRRIIDVLLDPLKKLVKTDSL